MENVIDVEYRQVTELEDKTTEVLTAEAEELYRQAESVAAVSMQMIVDAGMRLRVVKERIGHGGWMEWAKVHLCFSVSKANKMMKLAEEAEKTGSLFGNSETFTNIGISKVWALLAAPEEDAKEVMETVDIEEITVRELKAELKKVKEENVALSEAGEGERKTAKELADHVCELKAKLEMERKRAARAEAQAAEVPDTSELEEALEVSRQELKDYRAKVKKERDQEKAKAAAEREAIKAKAEADAKAAAEKEIAEKSEKAIEEAVKDAEGEMETLRKEIDRMQKLSDPATGEFKAHVDSLQREFNACLGAIDKAAPENLEKWRTALGRIIESMEGQL